MISYIAPGNDYMPIIEINNLLNFNMPLIIAGDYNVHHSNFGNTGERKYSHSKGKFLCKLILNRRPSFLDQISLVFQLL